MDFDDDLGPQGLFVSADDLGPQGIAAGVHQMRIAPFACSTLPRLLRNGPNCQGCL